MVVPVVNVAHMRVRMGQPVVTMEMSVGFVAGCARIVIMLMVGIVDVQMVVNHRLVLMEMRQRDHRRRR
jgi:hypothetical protein